MSKGSRTAGIWIGLAAIVGIAVFLQQRASTEDERARQVLADLQDLPGGEMLYEEYQDTIANENSGGLRCCGSSVSWLSFWPFFSF